MTQLSGIESFWTTIVPFLPMWKGLDVKAAVDENTHTLLSLVACLTPDASTYSHTWDSNRSVEFLRDSYSSTSALKGLLDGLAQGSIEIRGRKYSTVDFDPRNARSWGIEPTAATSMFGPDALARGWPDFRLLQRFRLEVSGRRNVREVLGQEETDTIPRRWGMVTFSELALHHLQFGIGDNYSSRVTVFAPIFATLETHAEVDQLTTVTRVHQALAVSEMKLHSRVQDYRGLVKLDEVVPLGEPSTVSSGYWSVFEHVIPLLPESATGSLHLFYGPHVGGAEPIASEYFNIPVVIPAVPVPRWELVLSAVSQTTKFVRGGTPTADVVRQWLGLGKDKPKDGPFEHGVNVLFFASGANVVSIGELDGVDQLVSADKEGQVLALISCTISKVEKKISPLVAQQKHALKRLPGSSVDAAIFAPVDPAEVPPSAKADCANHGISLMLLPEIRTLFELISSGQPDQAMLFLRQQVFKSAPTT